MVKKTDTPVNDDVVPERDAGRADRDVVFDKLDDAATPGFQAEFDPAEADFAGAFVEDALSEFDALASTEDLLGAEAEKPAFLDDDGPNPHLPERVLTVTARELYDLRPGETVIEAIDRKARRG